MHFIGDVHGMVKRYRRIIKQLGDKPSIQLGDFGFGFRNNTPIPDKWDIQHKFIRGNHDDPDACRKHPNYLGEYGITNEGIFYVGGGYSIDHQWRKLHNQRTKEVVWWTDEEIASEYFEELHDLYVRSKPRVVISHDCPAQARSIIPTIKNRKQFYNRTSDRLLAGMFLAYQPEVWIFGHYHESLDFTLSDTKFIGLDELEVFELEMG